MYARKPKDKSDSKSLDRSCVDGAVIVAAGAVATGVSVAIIADVIAKDLEQSAKKTSVLGAEAVPNESILLQKTEVGASDEAATDSSVKPASKGLDPKVARDLKITGAVFLGAAGVGLAAWKIHRLTNQKAQVEGIKAETDECRNMIDSMALDVSRAELRLHRLTESSEQSEINEIQQLINNIDNEIADFNQRNPIYHDDTCGLGIKLEDMRKALRAFTQDTPRLSV